MRKLHSLGSSALTVRFFAGVVEEADEGCAQAGHGSSRCGACLTAADDFAQDVRAFDLDVPVLLLREMFEEQNTGRIRFPGR
jgi:hypothetical protein